MVCAVERDGGLPQMAGAGRTPADPDRRALAGGRAAPALPVGARRVEVASRSGPTSYWSGRGYLMGVGCVAPPLLRRVGGGGGGDQTVAMAKMA